MLAFINHELEKTSRKKLGAMCGASRCCRSRRHSAGLIDADNAEENVWSMHVELMVGVVSVNEHS